MHNLLTYLQPHGMEMAVDEDRKKQKWKQLIC